MTPFLSEPVSVVITGIGMISPLGQGLDETLNKVRAGVSVAGAPTRFDPSPFSCRQCGEVGSWFDPEAFIDDERTLRLMNRDAVFAVAAARLAMQNAGVRSGETYPAERISLFGVTGLAGVPFEEVAPIVAYSAGEHGEFDPIRFGSQALRRVRPTLSFKILSNMPICFVSIFEGIKGPNAVFNPWEGQGAQALAAGWESIAWGRADCALVGGCDVKAHELGFISLQQHGCFENWKTEPVPGFPGEGAVFLVFEREDLARRRGARMYARLRDRMFASVSAPGIPIHDVRRDLIVQMQSRFPDFDGVVASGEGASVMRSPDSVLYPKRVGGNLFAAAAALQVGLGALWIRHKRDSETDTTGTTERRTRFAADSGKNRVLTECFGHGTEQAVFCLETPDQEHPSPRPEKVSRISSPRSRVVVTGVGVVSPVGVGASRFWKNLVGGCSGTALLQQFDTSGLSVRMGGEARELDLQTLALAFPGAVGERDRKVWLGLAALAEALADAGLSPSGTPADSEVNLIERASLHNGVSLEVFFLEDLTGLGLGQGATAGLGERLLKRQNADVRLPPLQTPLDRLTVLAGDVWGFGGGRFTNCSACAAGAQAIGQAFHRVRDGLSPLAVAGAADSMLNPLGLGGFSLLRALSQRNDEPESACRPFDASRDGTVLGEGAGFLVLETLEAAVARGRKPYAEILGYGSSLDAYRVSDPEPDGAGACQAMRAALEDAGLQPGQIDAVNAHGTGTPKNDVVETRALKEVLGDRARQIPIHAGKGATGHMIAAAGAVEAVASVLTLTHGEIPPTINLRNPDPDCDLDYVPGRSRPFSGRTILSNSFAFGGQNAVLIFGRTDQEAAHDGNGNL